MVGSSAAGGIDRAYLRFGRGVVDAMGPAAHQELVVAIPGREGVHGVASVAQQVALLGRRPDQPPESPAGDDRAERVHAGRSVAANRCEVAEPEAVLVEEGASRLGERGSGGGECLPAHHGGFRSPATPQQSREGRVA